MSTGMFRAIVVDPGEKDFECTLCHSSLKLEWRTEYGDPIVGEYIFLCPKCGLQLTVSVQVICKLIGARSA